MIFGECIRKLRLEAGLTQRELAGRVLIDFTYLSKIERGRVPPPSRLVIRELARQLGADEGELTELAGKFSTARIKELAQEDHRVAGILRRIQSGRLTKEQLERMLRVAEGEQ